MEWGEELLWFYRTQCKWIKYPRSSLIKIIIEDGMLFRKGEFSPQNISTRNEKTRGTFNCDHMFQVKSLINEEKIEKSHYARKLTKFYDRYDTIR